MSSDSFNYPGIERWKGRVAIVTGASSGIGYELSKRLVQLGVVVVGCARNIAAIEVRTYSYLTKQNKTCIYSSSMMVSLSLL